MIKPPQLPWVVRTKPEQTLGVVLLSAAVFVVLWCVASLGGLHYACTWKSLTGLPCAGCGGTRAALALFRGQWWEALRINPGVFVAVFLWMIGMAYSVMVLVFHREPWRPAMAGRMGKWRWVVFAGIGLNWIYLLIAAKV